MLFSTCFCVVVVASAVVAKYSFSAFCPHVALFSTSEACRAISEVWGLGELSFCSLLRLVGLVAALWLIVFELVLVALLHLHSSLRPAMSVALVVNWSTGEEVAPCNIESFLGGLYWLPPSDVVASTWQTGFALKCTPGWSDLVLLFLIDVLLASVGYKLMSDLLVCLADLNYSSLILALFCNFPHFL